MRRRDETIHDAFGDLRDSYQATRPSRFRKPRPVGAGGPADWHFTERELHELRECARAMDRDDAIIGQLVDRACNNIVRTGFCVEPDTGNANLDKRLWELWSAWANNPRACDETGRFTFGKLTWLALRHRFIDGDCFGVPNRHGRMELIEAQRCATPSFSRRKDIHCGVQTSASGRPEMYWFAPPETRSLRLRIDQYRQIAAFNGEDLPLIFHVFDASRMSLYRGVTALHAVMDIAGQFDDLNFAKLVQAQVCSYIAAFIEGDGPVVFGEQTNSGDANDREEQKLAPAAILRMRKGEKMTPFSPAVPNAEFFEHVKLLLALIGLPFGMPLVMALMDARETNFSGYRGALHEARLGFGCVQNDLEFQFCRPAYEWKVREWAGEGLLDDVGGRDKVSAVALLNHRWQKPGWPYIEPFKDAQANELRVASLQASPRTIAGELGADFELIASETCADHAYAIGAAMEKAKALSAGGEKVTWRDVLFLTKQTENPVAEEDSREGAKTAKKKEGADDE